MFSQVTQIGAIYQIPPAIDSLQWCKLLPADGNATAPGGSADDIDFDRLLPTLFEVFAIVFCGFLAGRCNLISPTDIKGLNDFTTYFTLPPLIFLNLVTINFQHVNWLFILSILLGKAIVFCLVSVVTATVYRPTNLAYAGIYGIFSTQGNDFGLAYPIVASLYGSKRPLYPGYMYLIAPTSLLFLNPIGFVLMEIQKHRESEEYDPKRRVGIAILRTVGNVSWNILRNPIVFVTLLGVFGNFLFAGGLPSVLFGILQILSSAFSASVLFLLGFSVARTSESKYSKKEGLLIPSVLLITKMLVSPLITRSSVSMLCASASDVEDLADFGFLYGMVPTGPIVMLFAAEYGLRTEMMASTMVLCTGLFGPVVFILARMLSLKVRGIDQFAEELRMTMLVLSVLSFLSCIWIGLSFILSKKTKRHIFKVTGCLMFSQIIMSVGIFVWSLFQSSEHWMSYVEITFIAAGQLMSRVWVAILGVTMVYLRRGDLRSPFTKNMFWPSCLGFGFPGIVVIMILIVTGMGHCEPDLDNELPLFIYGTTEAVGTIVVLILCLATTSLCLVLYFRTPPVQKTLSENMDEKRENLANKNLDIATSMGIAIDIDKCNKELPTDKNLLNSAGIAIYKMTNSDSDLVITGTERSKAQLFPDCEDKTEKTQWNICEGLKRSETSFSEKHLLSSLSSEASSTESSPTHSIPTSSSTTSSAKDDVTALHLRHVILLILCCISMAVGLTISTWKLSTNQPNGLFIAIEFLDAVLNVGQGVFIFMVFVQDSKYIVTPVSKWLRKVRHGFYSLDDPSDVVDSVIQQQCSQFQSYHWDNCLRDLPRTVRKNDRVISDCFTGTDFVDWVLKVGLATHRTAAENYGQRLFRGRMLISTDGAVQFHDNNAYLYSLEKTDRK